VRLELVLSTIRVNSFRPRLERDIGTRGIGCGAAAATREPYAFLPRRGEDRTPVGIARCRSGRRALPAAATRGLRRSAAPPIGYANLHTRTLRLLLLLLLTLE
jgi:hypothetical protein